MNANDLATLWELWNDDLDDTDDEDDKTEEPPAEKDTKKSEK